MIFLKSVLVVLIGFLYFTSANLAIDENMHKRVFDEDLYESVIDTNECLRQVLYLRAFDPFLMAQFLDAGLQFPRGVFNLNAADLGNYKQCLNIKSEIGDMQIEGKYYLLQIPLIQTITIPFEIPPNLNNTNKNFVKVKLFNEVQEFAIRTDVDLPQLDIDSMVELLSLNVAICVPKPCTTQDWTTNVLFNVSAFGFNYTELLVRLPDDKPWVPADYVAIAIFSLLGFITLLSTFYDINHIIFKKRDPKKKNIFLSCFSVYTNTQRLLTFAPNANALDCLDGIRTISMLWVIVCHTFQMYSFTANVSDSIEWLTSSGAVWITTGHYAVDTFFLIAGILLTYTTVGKMTGGQLIKRLHLFYLNRLLRMFPLLAALVLLEASVFHRIADGPYWEEVATNVQNCRSFWWTTLLHVQNFVNPSNLCIRHSWYIAIDIQLHIVAPIILYWTLGKTRRAAWVALIAGLLTILTISTVWNFIKNTGSPSSSLIDISEQNYYLYNYYYLPWTRGAPFFFGMIVGYVLYLYKGKKVYLNMGFVLVSWLISLGMIASAFYLSYETMQLDWDNQIADNLMNSYMKLVWSIGLSWIIFACVKGYGGPINWLLTLSVWKLPARLSFAMYLYHFPISFVISGTQLAPVHFSVGGKIYEFLSLLMLSFLLSFFLTVVIDAPFSILTKILLIRGQNKGQIVPQNGANSKAGLIPKNDIGDLEKSIITTLKKSEPPFEELEKKCTSDKQNGVSDKIENKIEKIAEPLSSHKET